jgi:cyclopropane-fatty-acyl-phospholipid synthase
MPTSATEAPVPLRDLAARLEQLGAQLAIETPGAPLRQVGVPPERARVRFLDSAALTPLLRGDHLALAEAYVHGRIDIEGDMAEVLKVTDVIALDESPWQRARLALGLALRGRLAMNRAAVGFHYDRPPEFFLPWFERWRSYSHGFWEGPDDDPSAAQARKMQHAIDALGVGAGDRVLDMGAGWGSFLEYAGRQGIHVHGITISREQHRYVEALIHAHRLPCSIEFADFFAYRPAQRFDGAVFLGTMEHVGDYAYAARFLARHLAPAGRVYADFCATREGFHVGRFLRTWIWPGAVTYVDLGRLVGEFSKAGLDVHELADDTLSYAWTVRDWASRLEREREGLAERFGEPTVRAFLLYLWGSYHFLANDRTQAYHLVAGRGPREARPRHASASATGSTHAPAKASPTRA